MCSSMSRARHELPSWEKPLIGDITKRYTYNKKDFGDNVQVGDIKYNAFRYYHAKIVQLGRHSDLPSCLIQMLQANPRMPFS